MDLHDTSEYRVEVDLPAEAFAHAPFEREVIASRMRALWLIEMVRERRLGYGKAAELAQVPKAEFVLLMGKHGVSPIDFDADELRRELDSVAEVGG